MVWGVGRRGAQGKSAQAEARKNKDHERLRTLIEANKPHVCVLGAASMDCNYIREQVRPTHKMCIPIMAVQCTLGCS